MQQPDHEVTWESFSKAFRAAHIPVGIMNLMKQKFLALKQGERLVREYLDEFTYLSRYAPRDVPDDAAKIERFMNGLSLELQDKLAPQDFRDFAHLVNKAIVCESKGKALEEERKRKRKAQKATSGNYKFPRPRYEQSASQPPRTAPPPQRERVLNSCPQHPNLQRHNYGGQLHNNQSETRSCYTCGQPGHISPNCPDKQPQPPRYHQQQQGRPQVLPSAQRQQARPPAKVHGRVNHVTAEEAQESPNVVLGMILANSAPACALFDSGASHSFVTQIFAKHINMHFESMNAPMIIQAPGSKLHSKQICQDVCLEIEGVEFLASLIVINSEGIDIILGMDWLSKHQGNIDCAKKLVTLINSSGEPVTFASHVKKFQLFTLSGKQTPSFDDVPVVHDFPHVFPEELSGLPPD
jgi:hypothetical protein